jgi:hypothetical protein
MIKKRARSNTGWTASTKVLSTVNFRAMVYDLLSLMAGRVRVPLQWWDNVAIERATEEARYVHA